jgi:hypothetical protein
MNNANAQAEGISTRKRLLDVAGQRAEGCRGICMILSVICPIRNCFACPLHLFSALHQFHVPPVQGSLKYENKDMPASNPLTIYARKCRVCRCHLLHTCAGYHLSCIGKVGRHGSVGANFCEGAQDGGCGKDENRSSSGHILRAGETLHQGRSSWDILNLGNNAALREGTADTR